MQPEGVEPAGMVERIQGFLPRTFWGQALCAATGLLVLSFAFAQPTIRPKREVTLTAQSVPLSVSEPGLDRVGELRFLGGLWLRSEDTAWGGLSGLTAETDGGEVRIEAVTDEGNQVAGRVRFENDRLAGVDLATIEPLLTPNAQPIMGKLFGDAESVARLPDGRVLVGFERRHRIWAYGQGLTGVPVEFPTPPALARAPENGGLESLAAFPDGRILAITEQMKTGTGNLAAFLSAGGVWAPLEWTASAPGFEASDAAVLPDGDLLVLERLWSALTPTDIRSRIMKVKGGQVKPGATLQGELVAELRAPLVAENFEGITAYRTAKGATRVLLVSDNNFNRAQRTLLLCFEIAAAAPPAKP